MGAGLVQGPYVAARAEVEPKGIKSTNEPPHPVMLNRDVIHLQLLTIFDVSEVMELMQRLLEQNEVNWRSLLSFVSVLLVCETTAKALFSGNLFFFSCCATLLCILVFMYV